MRFKLEPVTNPDEEQSVADGQFVAIAACPRCGRRWKSTGTVQPDDPNANEKLGARRVEMLALLRNGCPECSRDAGSPRDRQHGRLRSAWPGSRR